MKRILFFLLTLSILGAHGQSLSPGSTSCMRGVNCAPWSEEIQLYKKAVCYTSFGGSGFLIANKDGKAYVLTAKHVAAKNSINYAHFDLASRDFPNAEFYFNYEEKSCGGDGSGTNADLNRVLTVRGCRIVSMGTFGDDMATSGMMADYCLLELYDHPEIVFPDHEFHYLGWQRFTNLSDPYVGIHHPNGDFKKTSKATTIEKTQTRNRFGPTEDGWTHLTYDEYLYDFMVNNHLSYDYLSGSETDYRVTWEPGGVTAGGSSGSPLINMNTGRCIGLVRAGSSQCLRYGPDYYTSFGFIWDHVMLEENLDEIYQNTTRPDFIPYEPLWKCLAGNQFMSGMDGYTKKISDQIIVTIESDKEFADKNEEVIVEAAVEIYGEELNPGDFTIEWTLPDDAVVDDAFKTLPYLPVTFTKAGNKDMTAKVTYERDGFIYEETIVKNSIVIVETYTDPTQLTPYIEIDGCGVYDSPASVTLKVELKNNDGTYKRLIIDYGDGSPIDFPYVNKTGPNTFYHNFSAPQSGEGLSGGAWYDVTFSVYSQDSDGYYSTKEIATVDKCIQFNGVDKVDYEDFTINGIRPQYVSDWNNVDNLNLVTVGVNQPIVLESINDVASTYPSATQTWSLFDNGGNGGKTGTGPVKFFYGSENLLTPTRKVDYGSRIGSASYFEGVRVMKGLGPGPCTASVGDVYISTSCWDENPVLHVENFISECPMSIWVEDVTGKNSADLHNNPGGRLLLHQSFNDFAVENFEVELNQDYVDRRFPLSRKYRVSAVFNDGKQNYIMDSKIVEQTFKGVEAYAVPVSATCPGQPVSIGDANNPSGLTYDWAPITQGALSNLTGRNGGNPTFVSSDEGVFEYQFSVSDPSTGCPSVMQKVVVDVAPLIVPDVSVQGCVKTDYELSVTPNGGSGIYTTNWLSPQHLSNSNSMNVSANFFDPGFYSYQVNVSDDNGCAGTGTVSFEASEKVTLNLPSYVASECGEVVQIDAGITATSYEWFEEGSEEVISNTSLLEVDYPSTFILHANNGKNCVAEHSMYIDAYKVALGLHPGKILYKKKITYLNSQSKMFDMGDYNNDGINDLGFYRAGNFYISILDRLGNETQNLRLFSLKEDIASYSDTYWSLNYFPETSIEEAGDLDQNGVTDLVLRIKRFPLTSQQYDCSIVNAFNYTNQTVLHIMPKNQVEGVGIKYLNTIGDSRVANYIKVGNLKQRSHKAIVAGCSNDCGTHDCFSCSEDPAEREFSFDFIYKSSWAQFWWDTDHQNIFKRARDRYQGLVPSSTFDFEHSDEFGTKICGSSDIDGDGINDLIISAPHDDDQSGYDFINHYDVFERGTVAPEFLGCVKVNKSSDAKNFGALYTILLDGAGKAKSVKKISAQSSPAFSFKKNDNVVYNSNWMSLHKELGKDFILSLGDQNNDGYQEYLVTTRKDKPEENNDRKDEIRNYWLISLNHNGSLRRQIEVTTSIDFIIEEDKSFGMNLGDLTGNGQDEFAIANLYNIYMLSVDYQTGNLYLMNQIKASDFPNPTTSSPRFRNVSASGDFNDDGVTDLSVELSNNQTFMVYLDGMPRSGKEFIKDEIRWCGTYIGYDNRINSLKADVIYAGEEYCDGHYDYHQNERQGTNVYGGINAMDDHIYFNTNGSLNRYEGGYISGWNAPNHIAKNDIHLRATKEIIFGPGTELTSRSYHAYAEDEQIGQIDVYAKIIDPSMFEKCTAERDYASARMISQYQGELISFEDLTEETDSKKETLTYEVYPNPSSGLFTISAKQQSDEAEKVEVYNSFGTKVFGGQLENEPLDVDVSDLPSGVYFIHISNGSETSVKRVSLVR